MIGSDDDKTLTLASPKREDATLNLHVIAGPDTGRRLRVRTGDEVQIGSAAVADLSLSDSGVSRSHVVLQIVIGGAIVRDTGSKNGTFYGGVRLENAHVPVGAVLHLGNSTKVRIESLSDAGVPDHYGNLVGSSPAMRELYKALKQHETHDDCLVVLGESGTGKELVARAIHDNSSRAAEPFLILDCGSIAPELFTSMLFGHRQGSFTGAHSDREGIFEAAGKGTVFLDEIGELPLELQASLLRVVERREVTRLGDNTPIKVQTRLIAATHRDLAAMVEDGTFRKDLYYRLVVATVHLPPLRERLEDIPELVEHLAQQLGQPGFALEARAMEAIRGYRWPGNVRELRNFVSRAVHLGTVSGGPALQEEEEGDASTSWVVDPSEPMIDAKQRVVEAFERNYVTMQLRIAGGNMSEAARLANVDRGYFRRLCKRYGLT